MKSPAVQDFCVRVWELRERKVPLDARKLMRSLLFAMRQDMDRQASYNPACDARVEWCLAVLRLAAFERPLVEIEADLDFRIAMLLGREVVASGKDRGAGRG